jgi:hypothetical protein
MLVGEKRMRDLPMALVLEQLTNELEVGSTAGALQLRGHRE